ncbi:MAG: family oxidoreductase [Conexibacter sp.]|nr:family oxidoreductase [Conexibacter sp.]
MSTYLITGASSGIGAATALALDAAGHDVFAGVEHAGDGRHTLAAASSRLQEVVLDVTSQDAIGSVAAELGRRLAGRGLDGVVNNAGVGFPAPLELLPLEDLRRLLEVNVVGQVAVTQAVLPLIREAGGRVVFVGSVGGVLAAPFAGSYHASKFALEAIADVWRQELDPEELPVILIEPSAISTPIWDKAITYLDVLLAHDGPGVARYAERLRSFRESLRSADQHGKDAGDVAGTILEALTTEHPDTRYVVGASGKIATALRPLIPDRLADKLGERTA